VESVNGTGVDEAQQHDIPSRTRDIVEPKKKENFRNQNGHFNNSWTN
jgi:hypothetical protein